MNSSGIVGLPPEDVTLMRTSCGREVISALLNSSQSIDVSAYAAMVAKQKGLRTQSGCIHPRSD